MSRLKELASYLEDHGGKVEHALSVTIRGAIEAGDVNKGEFTASDWNTLQSHINSQKFMAEVLEKIARQELGPAMEGASREAALSKAKARLLKQFQKAVASLVF